MDDIKPFIDKAKDILIVTHQGPTFDSIGSALSLYLAMKNMGKNVTIGCPTPMTVELSNFVGANKVQTSFAKKNFVISLDYEDGSIDKVTYNIDGNKFNLVIEPRSGYEGFSEDRVSYSHQGASFDLVFSVDTIHLGGLGALYEKEKELFAGCPIVNIDSHENNTMYGKINIMKIGGTTAEIIAEILSHIGVPLTEDIATNLMNALYHKTENFQKFVTPYTFDIAGLCMKAGGKRFTAEPVRTQIAPQQNSQQTQQPAPVTSPPEDWLKPKIYKSSNLL